MKQEVNIKSLRLNPLCSECNNSAAKIEIVEPYGYPQAVNGWNKKELKLYCEFRNFESNYLIYSGSGGSYGIIGDSIDLQRKSDLIKAFTKPYNPIEIRNQFYDMAGYCVPCGKFYCSEHWNISSTGYGKCPNGHGKSLDAHWSPNCD